MYYIIFFTYVFLVTLMLYRLYFRQTWKIYSWKPKDNRINNNAGERNKIKHIVLDNKITRIKRQMLFILLFLFYSDFFIIQ